MAKRHNIEPVLKNFKWGDMLVITLGEEGRGRKLTLIPYHAPENATLLKISYTRTGRPKIVQSESNKGWLAVVTGRGTYTRGTYGTVYSLPEDKEKIKVIAYGRGAYGAAGRIGDWNEFLVYIPDGTFLKIRPAGGPHKRARYWLYFGKDKVYRIEKEEMDLFCEQMGLDRPPEKFDELVDLIKLVDKAGDIEEAMEGFWKN